MTGRDRLLAALSPELVAALEQLVDDRVAERLAGLEPNGGSPLLSIEDAAGYLGVSRRTLERRIKAGELEPTYFGRRALIGRADLDELVRTATGEDATPATSPRRRLTTLDGGGIG